MLLRSAVTRTIWKLVAALIGADVIGIVIPDLAVKADHDELIQELAGVFRECRPDYGPDRWIPSSYMPTIPGQLFYLDELAGPLLADIH